MAMELAAAYVTIVPRTTGFGKAINSAMGQAGLTSSKVLSSQLQKGMGTAGVAIGNLLATGISKCASVIAGSVGDAISRYDTLSNFSNVMSNLGIATEDAEKARDKLSKGLEGLPTTLQDGVSAVQRFTSANSDIDKSTDMFLALNNAILAGGGSTQVQASALEQVSQAYSKGKMDMIEWRSIQTAMPAQIKQVAQSMGMSTDALGEGLRNGDVSMEKFMQSIIKLNNQGGKGFASLKDQAKTATGGIATNITLCKTRVVAGMANIMSTIDEELSNAGLPKIGEAIGEVATKISEGFKDIQEWIKEMNIGETIKEWQPYFDSIKEFVKTVKPYVKSLIEALIKGSPYLAKSGKWFMDIANGILANKGALVAVAGALSMLKLGSFLGLLPSLKGAIGGVGKKFGELKKKISAPKTTLAKFGDTVEKTGKKASKSGGLLKKLASGVKGFIAVGVGLALVSASFWLLADAATKLAAAGPVAIAVMAGMVLAIAGLVVLFALMGQKLTAAMPGIIACAAAFLIMAAAMAILAFAAISLSNAGGLAIGIMAGFIVVIILLVAAFAIFGPALNAAIPGMIVFGAVVAGIVLSITALVLAITLLTAMITLAIVTTAPYIIAIIQTIGNTIIGILNAIADAIKGIVSTVGDTICNIITTIGETIEGIIETCGETIEGVLNSIGDNVTKVVDSITGGISDIIETACDGVSKIIDSIGDAISGVIDSMTGFVDALVLLGLVLPKYAEYGGAAAGGLLKFGGALASLSFGDDETASMTKLSKAIQRISGTAMPAAMGLKNCQMMAMGIPKTFNKAADAVQAACKKIRKSINNMKLKIPRVEVGKLPELTFKAGKKSKTEVTLTSKVDWYRKGGIFDSASLIGVGEAGSEAVLPLNKKTLGAIGDGIADSSDNRQQNIVINLNYSADADANQMVADIARGLRRMNLAGA